MKKRKFLFSILFSALLLFQAAIASAYSYGKPDEENIATVYSTIYSELQKTSPDWAKMSSAFATVKDEIANPHHFGAISPKIASYFENKIAKKDKTGLIENYQALLVLNIERRLKFAENSFSDYSQAKLIIAKGYATFRELKPTISGKIAASTLNELDRSFNILVEEALGNPGLFGIGKREPNKALYDQHQNKILNTLKPKFSLNLTASAPAGAGILLTIDRKAASINGKGSTLEAAPYIQSGRTFVPLRFISEGLGANVKWNAATRTVVITSGSKSIQLPIGSFRATQNGTTVKLDAPAEIKIGRTFVPVRFISEVLGYKVNWNAAAKTVTIQ